MCWNFHRLFMNVLHELRFFDKIEGCMLRGCNFIKMLLLHRVFSQNIFKTASFRYIFEKKSVVSFFMVKLQSENCRLVTLLKETPL